MKRIERINLIDTIGRELQGRMSTSDINVYLAGFGIPCQDGPSIVGSKWVYVKEFLAHQPDEVIIKITDENDD